MIHLKIMNYKKFTRKNLLLKFLKQIANQTIYTKISINHKSRKKQLSKIKQLGKEYQ